MENKQQENKQFNVNIGKKQLTAVYIVIVSFIVAGHFYNVHAKNIILTSPNIDPVKQQEKSESPKQQEYEVIDLVPTPTPTPTPLPTPEPTPEPTAEPEPESQVDMSQPSSEKLNKYFQEYAEMFGIDVDLLVKIAQCESGFNTTSHNEKYDYAGMYQFSAGTWQSNRNAMGEDPNPDLRFNAKEAIKTAAFLIKNRGAGAWPSCN